MSRALRKMVDDRHGTAPAFVTIPDCAVENYLSRFVRVIVCGRHTETHEYRAIETYYGRSAAARSGQPYMNHIDEGLGVLSYMGANENTKRIFTLHPLIQVDEAMRDYQHILRATQYSDTAVAGAWQYRDTANAYLPSTEGHPGWSEASKIMLSENTDVNMALVADKIQNNKDFSLHLDNGHYPEDWRRNLRLYFSQWRKALGITDITYATVCELVTVPEPRITREISL